MQFLKEEKKTTAYSNSYYQVNLSQSFFLFISLFIVDKLKICRQTKIIKLQQRKI